jgi:hypothetical protein
VRGVGLQQQVLGPPWLGPLRQVLHPVKINIILAIIILPAVWRGGRRVDSWNQSRKAAYSWTAILYLIFSVTLGFWGALTPWHS